MIKKSYKNYRKYISIHRSCSIFHEEFDGDIRFYGTTTQRRIFNQNGHFSLSFIDAENRSQILGNWPWYYLCINNTYGLRLQTILIFDIIWWNLEMDQKLWTKYWVGVGHISRNTLSSLDHLKSYLLDNADTVHLLGSSLEDRIDNL